MAQSRYDGDEKLEPLRADLPTHEAYLSIVDNLPVLVMKGIPLTREAAISVFWWREDITVPMKEVPLPDSFDLVHLATDDIIGKDPNDVRSIKRDFIQKYGVVEYYREQLKGAVGKKSRYREFVERERDARREVRDRGTQTTFAVSDRQEQDLGLMLIRLFDKKTDPTYGEFRETVKRNPNKKFLLIHGHGSGAADQPWSLGERSGPLVDLSSLLDELRRKHGFRFKDYSAIVLSSCNAVGKQPPKVDGVPVFYTEGVASMLENRRGKILQ